MPPKKATAAKPAKTAAAAPHASYKDMIKEAILALKERNGSSRPSLKKYLKANHKNLASSDAVFDTQFNKAIKSGVEKGDFAQPKGPSGTVKLAKKEAVAKPTAASTKEKKPAAKKATKATKPAGTKTAGRPKKTDTKTAATKAAPKKASTTKATKTKAAPTAKAAKANTSTKRVKKTPAMAPAIVEETKISAKTASGRITKGPAKTAGAVQKKKPAPKAKKAATPKKPKSTPKKTETPATAA
ncbi:hypothetical protein HO173_000929 [Letharia columbiana]|uniref:Histone H1 n=1 Tax=Letharia columbiana TaxID=112416 RepID=A0A8H6G5S0_9LECA|nr:uncharacterized protein HO173_000929 [Letharia columbiana]KAF6241135.1 hypothetical protein HO173_000929 [Letharia columbiana]